MIDPEVYTLIWDALADQYEGPRVFNVRLPHGPIYNFPLKIPNPAGACHRLFFFAKACLPGADDRLGPVYHLQLGENA